MKEKSFITKRDTRAPLPETLEYIEKEVEKIIPKIVTYKLQYKNPFPTNFFALGKHKIASNSFKKYELDEVEQKILAEPAAQKWLLIEKVN